MDRARVAELIVMCAQGRRRGSGYRVTRDAVLTAAHVLEDAVSVEVRFEPDLPDEWVSAAVSWWADARSDAALLLISPRTEGETLAAEEFGRLGDGPAVLDVQAVGFPRWKLRVDPDSTGDEPARYRDACHAVGSVATLSNWREGTLEVALAFSPAPEPDSSPWEGMSGAALWVGNRIIGVISKHHPGDGPSTLAAVRLDRALEIADPPMKQALHNLAGLPEQAAQLPSVVPALTGHDAVEPVEVCPYPTDMAAFRPEQAEWFFGREELASQLVARLDNSLLHGNGPLIVVAPSGAGKSSLLQAGLLPKLDQAVLPGSRSWPRLLLTPTHQPMTAITTAFAALLSDEPTTVAMQLTEDLDRFVERLHRVMHALGDTAETTRPRLMLIVDQLEELFTLCADKRERQRFLELISRLSETTPSGHDPAALVVYGLRADFYARCADHPQLLAALQDNQLVVGPMSQGELRDAICKPAEHAGLGLEETLVEVMLRDLGAGSQTGTEVDGYEAGRLPLLAHALRATWRERHGNTLTLVGYQSTGGIQKAVETTADGVYAKLDEDEQRTARTLFLRLVRLGGDDADDTRRRVPRAELLRDTTDAARIHQVLDAFTQARLLTQYQDTVEITHEALLRAWPTLRRWIDTGRSAHLLRQDLDEAAQTWHRHGRSNGALLRGSRLQEAREGINEQDLSPLGIEFLAASTQHEHDVARRRRRTLLGGWGLAALVGVLTIFLGIQLVITQHEKDNALFRQIKAQADQLYGQNPSLAAQLNLVAHEKRSDDPDVNTNLLSTAHTPLSNPLPNIGGAYSTALSSDGKTLVTIDSNKRVRVWNLSDPSHPNLQGRPLPGSQAVALSADGKILATGTDRGGNAAQLWDVSDPTHPTRRGPPLPLPQNEALESMALSGRGDILATANIGREGSGGYGGTGEVRLWDMSNPARPTLRRHPLQGGVYSVALSGDGDTLATGDPGSQVTTASGGGAGEIRLWDVSDPTKAPQPRGMPLPGNRGAASVALSGDGKILATGPEVSGNGETELWNVSNPSHSAQIPHFLAESRDVASVALSGDGRTLVTTDSNNDGTSGQVRLWDIPSSFQIGRDVSSVMLSSDGRTLATTSRSTADSLRGEELDFWDISDSARPTFRGRIPISDYFSSAALSGDGKTLAISKSSLNGGYWVELWNISNLTRPTFQGRVDTLLSFDSMALSGDGKTLVIAKSSTSGAPGTELWDVSNPVVPYFRGNPLPNSQGSPSVALSGDGKTLATSPDFAGEVRLWDVSNLMPGQSAREHPIPGSQEVLSVAFSGDGKTLSTSAGIGGEVRLWDVSNLARPAFRGRPLSNTRGAHSVALSGDGKTLVTSGDAELRIWNQQQAIRRICATTKNNLGPGEWSQYIPNQPFDPFCMSS